MWNDEASFEPLRRPHRSGENLVRSCLRRRFGWLPAYPAAPNAARWVCLPWNASGPVTSYRWDRDAVRKMEFALQRMQSTLYTPLSEFVEDRADWLGRMDYLLSRCKPSVGQDARLDFAQFIRQAPVPTSWRRRWIRLHCHYPDLEPLLTAVGFLELTGLCAPSPEPLEWIHRHAGSLSDLRSSSVGRKLQVRLTALRQYLPDEWPRRMADWLHADLRTTPIEAFLSFLQASEWDGVLGPPASSSGVPVPTPVRTFEQLWLQISDRLLEDGPKHRELRSQFLATVVSDAMSEKARRLTHWFRHVAGIEEPLSTPRASGRAPEAISITHDRRWRSEIQSVQNLLRLLLSLREPLSAEQFRLLETLADLQPTLASIGEPLNSDAIGMWFRMACRTDVHATLSVVLTELQKLIARQGVSENILLLLASLAELSCSRKLFWLDGVAAARNLSSLLERIVCDDKAAEELSPLCERDIGTLVVFSNAAASKAAWDWCCQDELWTSLAIQWCQQRAPDRDSSLSEESVRAALALSDGDSAEALALLQALADASYPEEAYTLGALLKPAPLRALARGWVKSGGVGRIEVVSDTLTLVQRLKLSPPEFSHDLRYSPWMEVYPEGLRGVLAQLETLTEDASQIAERCWREEVPSHQDVQRELSAVELRLPQLQREASSKYRWLQRRRDILQARLANPTGPTARQLQRITERLTNRADELLVDQFCRECRHRVGARLTTLLGTSANLNALLEPPGLEVLCAVLSLSERQRRLGLWILGRYLENHIAGFLEESPNAEFLERLRNRGMDPEPWLNPEFASEWIGVAGRPYGVKFERDLLEILRMGAHFKTCLAPGDENFFGTLANAVDVNKQVLFGRRADGTVVGRCLFTLTDEGHILTYHRYAHDPREKFDDATRHFAEQLAAAMGTTLVTQGRVARLVAHTWYDDGAVSLYDDHDDHLGLLQEEDVSADDGQWAHWEQKAGGSDRLAAQLIDRLRSDESLCWPAAQLNRLQQWSQSPTMTSSQRWELAVQAQVLGHPELARQVAAEIPLRDLFAHPLGFLCPDCQTYHHAAHSSARFEILSELHPTLTLRLIRRTRPRGVRSDHEETDPVRRAALSRVHQALGRRQRAEALAEATL